MDACVKTGLNKSQKQERKKMVSSKKIQELNRLEDSQSSIKNIQIEDLIKKFINYQNKNEG